MDITAPVQPAEAHYTRYSVFKMMANLAAVIGRDSSLTIALVLVRVAAAGDSGVLQATLQRELDISGAALSRSVQTLSDLRYGKSKPGLGLIARTLDDVDGRHHVLKLTKQGLAALEAAFLTAKVH